MSIDHPNTNEGETRANQDLAEPSQAALPHIDDLERIRRDNYKLRTALASAIETIEQEGQSLSRQLDGTSQALQQAVEYLSSQLDLRDQLIAERLKTARLTQELNSWRQCAIAYAHVLERTLTHPCLTEAYRAAATKLLHDYVRLTGPLGIDLIMPQQGDLFDPRIHQIVGEEDVQGVPPLHVVRTESWGIRDGATVLERAEVVVTPSDVD